MKIILDVNMLILFLLEMNHNLTGQLFHEIIGVILAVLVVVHLMCNRRWFISIVQNQNRNWKKSILVFVNLLMLFSFVGLLLSGVMISGYILPDITLGSQRVWSEIHHLLINAIEILGAIHVLAHLRTVFLNVKNKKNKYVTMGMILSCLVIAGLLVVRFIDWTQDNSEHAIAVNQQETERISEIVENKEDIVETTNGGNTEKKNTEEGSIQSNSDDGILEISFDFNRAGTPASNQYAVWIEETKDTDTNRDMIQNVVVRYYIQKK
jgi:heme/copper-type cytochrome/quinol oxidase subunit 4